MSRIGVSSNIMQPDAKCLSCKYWKKAGIRGMSGISIEPGSCTTGYCKKDFNKRGKKQ